jgi:hypothetical protein
MGAVDAKSFKAVRLFCRTVSKNRTAKEKKEKSNDTGSKNLEFKKIYRPDHQKFPQYDLKQRVKTR